MQDPFGLAVALGLSAGVGVLYGVLSVQRLAKARYLKDTPASKIRSAAQGFVELHGELEVPDTGLIHAPLSGAPCVWWRYKIEEAVESDKTTRWQVRTRKASDAWLKLTDGTGHCLINPAGATVYCATQERWFSHARPGWPRHHSGRYRVTEERLHARELIYAAGGFVSSSALGQGFDVIKAGQAVIGLWKQDYQGLLQRFDGNRDGKLDQHEWARVQRAALAHAKHTQRALENAPAWHQLTRPDEGQPFVISSFGKAHLVRKLYWQSAALAGICLLGVLAGYKVLQEHGLSL